MTPSRKILVVDDSKLQRVILRDILVRHGYEVQEATMVDEAIKVLETFTPELILSDIVMPEKNGFELIAYLKENKIPIPVIMITTSNINDYLKLAKKWEVGHILSKTYSEEQILQYVENILNQSFFGLDNYLSHLTDKHRIVLHNSKDINTAMRDIKEYAQKSMDFHPKKLFYLYYFLGETITNAFFHAHGFSKEKLPGEIIILPEGKEVVIEYGHNQKKFGFAVLDQQGTFSRMKALESIETCLASGDAIAQGDLSDIPSSGRGIHTIRVMADEFFVNIHKGHKTEVVVLMYPDKSQAQSPAPSLFINEI